MQDLDTDPKPTKKYDPDPDSNKKNQSGSTTLVMSLKICGNISSFKNPFF
jgi:hypothetical protein